MWSSYSLVFFLLFNLGEQQIRRSARLEQKNKESSSAEGSSSGECKPLPQPKSKGSISLSTHRSVLTLDQMTLALALRVIGIIPRVRRQYYPHWEVEHRWHERAKRRRSNREVLQARRGNVLGHCVCQSAVSRVVVLIALQPQRQESSRVSTVQPSRASAWCRRGPDGRHRSGTFYTHLVASKTSPPSS